MEFINARKAAKITSAARTDIALVKMSLAECCVKEDIMPYIVEEAECGGNVVVVEIALNSDAYKVRDLIILILKELGYDVKLEEDNEELTIKW